MVSVAEANRQYFDSISEDYDGKIWFQKTNDQIRETIRGDLEWIGIPLCNTANDAPKAKEVRLLDYACGTGLMSRTLGPYVTKTLAMDVSPNMVKTYNAKVEQGQLSKDVAFATVGNLLDKSDLNPTQFASAEWQNFDIASVGLAFHHFEDPLLAAKQMRQRLRSGGVLIMTDFLEGGDMLADENGNAIPGSEGNHLPNLSLGHHHGHGHGHGHGHRHGHENGDNHHQHHHHHHFTPTHYEGNKPVYDDETKKTMMETTIIVPHFTVEGVKQFLLDAGFVDVDVRVAKKKSYMEFSGNKMFRTLLFARGRNPSNGQH